MNEPKLKKAMTTLEFLSQDREARMQYEARQKYLHDEASLMEAAKNAEIYGFKTGLESGIKQGIEQGIGQGIELEKKETARKLLALGLDLSAIAEVSGLSMDEIGRLKDEKN